MYCQSQVEHCGLERSKESRNKENLPASVCHNINLDYLNLRNKETCSRRLNFEQEQKRKNTLKELEDAIFEDGEKKNKLDELNKEFFEKKQAYNSENQNKMAKSWSQIEIGKTTDITTTSLKAFCKELEVEGWFRAQHKEKIFPRLSSADKEK